MNAPSRIGQIKDAEGCEIEVFSNKRNYVKETEKAFEKCENYKQLISEQLRGFSPKAAKIRYESRKQLVKPLNDRGFKVVMGETTMDFRMWLESLGEEDRKDVEEIVKVLPEVLNLKEGSELTYRIMKSGKGGELELHIVERPLTTGPVHFTKAVPQD